MEGAPASREQRKTVTVLFCDVTGSTALGESTDPEALRALLARYFERMKGIVESHGGTVEKFIGDAVMAVFGVPQVHEDDALRACRAAVEMREALPELGVQARIGLNTGEVVTGTEERLATGDAVNVAARLEQAAQPGEILIGADDARARPRRGRDRRGRAAGAEGQGRARSGSPARRGPRSAGAPARDALRRQVERAGEPADSLAARPRGATVRARDRGRRRRRRQVPAGGRVPRLGRGPIVAGRCLPYGEGITYWPVVEVLKQLDALPSDPAAAASLRSLLGETDEGTSAEEIAWAFRKLLEERSPLVCVFDDIQWGEETFLDLVEGVALLSSQAPILLLCMARPDLSERRPAWPVRAPARAARRGRRGLAAPRDDSRGRARADRPRGRRQPALHHRDGGDGPGDRGRGDRPAQPAGAARRTPRPAREPRSAPSSSGARSKGRSSTAARSRLWLPRNAT